MAATKIILGTIIGVDMVCRIKVAVATSQSQMIMGIREDAIGSVASFMTVGFVFFRTIFMGSPLI